MAIDTQPQPQVREAAAHKRRHRLLRRVGKALISIGVLLLLFVVYELWGTNFITARSQNNLRSQLLDEGLPGYGFRHTDRFRGVPGEGIGYIRIPDIDLDLVFVEGTDIEQLKKGPGHYKDTPLPGQKGNVGIAGHRTTYGAPFWSLSEIEIGDRVILDTSRGHFVYRVNWLRAVSPTDTWVLDPTDKRPVLTLTTCNPRFSASQRLVLRAVQIVGPHPAGTELAPFRVIVDPDHNGG